MFLTSGYIFTGSILPCEIISRGKFELDCFRQMKVQMIQNIELSSTMVEPDVQMGRPTQEPERIERCKLGQKPILIRSKYARGGDVSVHNGICACLAPFGGRQY